MADLFLGEIVVPSGTLVIADPQTLDEAGGDGDGEGEAAVIEGLPTTPIKVWGVPSDVGPWIDELRLDFGKSPDGDEAEVSALVPAVHQIILIDVDETDRFAFPQHYDQLTKALGSKAGTCANIANMRVGIAMLALQAVGSESDVIARYTADGELAQIVVSL